MSKTRVIFIRSMGLLVLAGLFLAVVLYLSGLVLKPRLSESAVYYPDEVLQAVEVLRDTQFDPEGGPVLHVDVDYREGAEASWWPRGESPLLAELVAEGLLPPVAERVGPEPVVMRGVDGIGNYGGTWFRVANSPSDLLVVDNRLSGANLVRWSPLGYPIRPHLAKGWEVSEDRREWTFFLRQGVRWSDGYPFTADDILYWWESEIKYFSDTPPAWMLVGGESGRIEKVDDYTVRFVFQVPYGNFLEKLAEAVYPYSPRHYLEPFHPELGDEERIARSMQSQGLTDPVTHYNRLKLFRNPEHPRMWPWVYRTYRSTSPEAFVRNPYYWVVDEEGNQLPYLDRLLFSERSGQLIPIAAASGELSMQARHIRYEDYTLLMENREANAYEVYHWYSADRSQWTLWPNLNRRISDEDPASANKAALLRERTFRQALSLAIDREKIIRALYSGFGEPAQIAPGRESLFHHEGLLKSFTDYDPEEANRKLDELGLAGRDREGMRLFPDGSRMTWYIDFTDYSGEGPAQFIVDDWARVGIRAIHRQRSRPLFWAEKMALVHDFTVWSGMSEYNPLVAPRSFVAESPQSHFAQAYGAWYTRGGLHGLEHPLPGGLREPEPGSAIRRGQELLVKAIQAPNLKQQVAIMHEILSLAEEEVWSISIATSPAQLVVVKDGFRNVPRKALAGYTYITPANAGIETYFWDQPSDSPGAVAEIKRSMVEVRRGLPGTAQSGEDMARLIWNLFAGICVLLLVLAALRHPYIGRRLLVLVPTLFIISVIVFYIIQLPPGDFVETRILQLQLTGDESEIREVERLRASFHLDEPFWGQYSRWVGLRWFITYDKADKGLLQGYMGRSMETQNSVNAMVGDRILLTFLVSLGTILFTWAVAIPIGIYSAVRQYTLGDYLFSFIGFIGMCIPNFLLAIVMMYLSSEYLGINVTGLFSPEYAAAPEWTWGKVVDLLQHIWVPIIVIGTAGTAGMIRVMRGNLLDELGKPYVTTARAKGVRPFKLLMKYPVRLALNPFVSGLGHLFPQLISGGAIIAIVLSLPMVGPLMLQGLMTQDIYLAGSMLMVLSLFGVLGTLVSDLLLMWLDPRIRMEGGSK